MVIISTALLLATHMLQFLCFSLSFSPAHLINWYASRARGAPCLGKSSIGPPIGLRLSITLSITIRRRSRRRRWAQSTCTRPLSYLFLYRKGVFVYVCSGIPGGGGASSFSSSISFKPPPPLLIIIILEAVYICPLGFITIFILWCVLNISLHVSSFKTFKLFSARVILSDKW